MNKMNLAMRLDSFAKEYDYYGYMDNSEEGSIYTVFAQLSDKKKVEGIVIYLEEAIAEMDKYNSLYKKAKALLRDMKQWVKGFCYE